MNTFVLPLLASALMLAAATAQEQRDPLAFRDFEHLKRVRVVCEHQHFGRVVDLIADVPSGRITSAVLSMTTDDGNQVVAAPIGHLRYEPQSDLLQLGPCLDDAELHTPFDAARVRLERQQDGDGT